MFSMRSFRSVAAAGSLMILSCEPSSGDVGDGSVGLATAALSGPDDALAELRLSLDPTVHDRLEVLNATDRANLVNALAWYDEDPRMLNVVRGRGGSVAHVSARFLAYDVAPSKPAVPSQARADAALDSGGLARELLALGATDALSFESEHPLRNSAAAFAYSQRWSGIRVYGAGVTLDLSSTGRMTQLDSTVVPNVAPASGILISAATAETTALDHLLELGGIWIGATISVEETEEVIVNRLEHAGIDDERRAWRFVLTTTDPIGGEREVLVDRIDDSVIASFDLASYLDGDDQIRGVEGTIGCDPTSGDCEAIRETGVIPWIGTSVCPAVTSPLSSAPDVFDRDWDEAAAALCEAEQFFQSRGAEVGIGDADSWIDPSHDGIAIGIGATPGLSIGVNARARIVLATGTARVEVVGHELFHTAMRPDGAAGLFGAHGAREGKDIEEHLCDTFGMLLERRFAARRAPSDCHQTDDADAIITIGDQDPDPSNVFHAYRPCADEMIDRPWRNACEPTEDNGGWCEGAERYGDLAYNKYDAYGRTVAGTSEHIASHTNLGLGNRAVMSLLGEVLSPRPYTVEPASDETMESWLVTVATRLRAGMGWSRYAQEAARAAADLTPTTPMSPFERSVRGAFENADIWSVPAEIQPRPTPTGGPTTIAPAPTERPAVASVALVGASAGEERTFVFYRPSATSTAVEFVWRDEPRGGASTDLTDGWLGPCAMPAAVSTQVSPAAAASDEALFFAWSHPTGTPDVGTLRGLRLTGEDASSPTGTCTFNWIAMDPPEERLVVGSPSIAVWGNRNLVRCEVLSGLPGITYPFRGLAAMGLGIGGCVDIGERYPDFPLQNLVPGIGQSLLDRLEELVDSLPANSVPQPSDPWAPRLPEHSHELWARVALMPQLRGNASAESKLVSLPAPIGPRFSDAFSRYGLPRGTSVEMILEHDISGWTAGGLPEGEYKTISYRFDDHVLVVGFTGDDGNLRAATWDSEVVTDELPILSDAPNTGVALTTVEVQRSDGSGGRASTDYLYAVYGTTEGASLPRLSYRVAQVLDADDGITSGTFGEEGRLDTFEETIGLRRQRDYRFLRTQDTPVIASGIGRLHVFVVSLQHLGEEPNDLTVARETFGTVTDRIRYATFDVPLSGLLAPRSERPVVLLDTRAPALGGQAGAAYSRNHRGRLRWFYPNGSQLGMRSESVH